MAGFLDGFRKTVISSVWKDKAGESVATEELDDKIALGVLLWVVAEADDRFLPEEEKKIKDVLVSYSKVSHEDIPVVLASIQEAARNRIDLYTFTREVSDKLPNAVKKRIMEDLFRIACVDKDLNDREYEAIRKISGLFNLGHSDFIDAKIKIKKEFGLDTAGF